MRGSGTGAKIRRGDADLGGMDQAAYLLLVLVVSTGASLLTLFSGFGLGTLLLPVFALLFPVEVAVAMTAVVHALNNGVKLGLLARWTDLHVLVRFGPAALVGAFAGAWLLGQLSGSEPLYQGLRRPVGPTAFTIALLMLLFALTELSPRLSAISAPRRWLVPGGLVSGFFGGLSGHQGALRTMFLLRSGMTKEAFIATGVAVAVLVDLTRIPVYLHDLPAGIWDAWPVLLTGTMGALGGAVRGRHLLPKVTYRAVRLLVGLLMVGVAVTLLLGLT